MVTVKRLGKLTEGSGLSVLELTISGKKYLAVAMICDHNLPVEPHGTHSHQVGHRPPVRQSPADAARQLLLF